MTERPITICPLCGAKKLGSPNIKRDEEIRSLYHSFWSIEDLSKKFALGDQRIKQIIGHENLRIADRYKHRSLQILREKRNEKIFLMHKEGKSFTQIGREVYLSAARVSQIVRKIRRRGHEKK